MQAIFKRRHWVVIVALVFTLASVASLTLAAEKKAAEAEKKSTENAAIEKSKAAPDTKLAAVNGKVITQADFDREMTSVQQQIVAMGTPLTDARLAEIRQKVLDNLIEGEILYQESQKQGIKIDQAAIDERFEKARKRFPDEAKFQDALKKANLSEAQLKAQYQRGMAIDKLIDKEIVEKISIPESETKAYYAGNPDKFKQPEQVRASHILILVDKNADEAKKAEARKKIEDIQKKLKEGGDFAALAKEFSQCPSASKGGDLNYFRRGQMVKPFEDAAFALKPGETSDIVETVFGYHLIKVTDKKPESTVAYEDVKEKLGEYLKQAKVQDEVTAYIAKLKETAKVEKFLKEDTKKENMSAKDTEKKETK